MGKLYQQHFLKLLDLEQSEVYALLAFAQQLKEQKQAGQRTALLSGLHFAFIYETVLLTRPQPFEIAANELGAQVTYIGLHEDLTKSPQSLDQAQIEMLTHNYDGIFYCGVQFQKILALAEYAKCPVWHGFTQFAYPTRVLSDLLTIQQHHQPQLQKIKLTYLGDARGNIAASLVEAAALMGMDLRLVGPKACWPQKKLIDTCAAIGKRTGAEITLTEDVVNGIKDIDFLYLNIWMPQINPTELWHKRLTVLSPKQIIHNLNELAGSASIKYMHTVPAAYNMNSTQGQTKVGDDELFKRETITKALLEADPGTLLAQIENHVHLIQALMLSTLLKSS